MTAGSNAFPVRQAAGRLLIITGSFPPHPAVGGLRWAGLGKHLARRGWKVAVLTMGTARGVRAVDGVVVHECAPGSTVRDLYRALRRAGSRDGAGEADALQDRLVGSAGSAPATDAKSGTVAGDPVGIVDRLRGEAAALLTFPDEGRGWILRASMVARRIVQEFRPSVVVSSGPPHSAHLVSWMATRGRTVRRLLDFRDPWAPPSLAPWVGGNMRRSAIARRGARWLERFLVERATGLLATTPELAAMLSERYSGARVYFLTNGVDAETLPPRSKDVLPGLAIVHNGSLLPRRDPVPVMRALRKYLDENPRARSDGTRIRFVGDVEPVHLPRVRVAVEALSLEDHVEFLERQPRARALQLLARSGLALVLAQEQREMVPAKIYESVGLGLPTLVVAERDSAAAAAATRLGAWTLEPHDIDGMARLFREVESGTRPARSATQAVDYAVIAREAECILLDESVFSAGGCPAASAT